MSTNIGQTTSPRRGQNLDLKGAILDRIRGDKSILVWTPNDFLDLGSRSAVDKTLAPRAFRRHPAHRSRALMMFRASDVPRVNSLTGKPSIPDYTAIIDAVARREKARFLPDGITAGNNWASPTRCRPSHGPRRRPLATDSLDRLVIDSSRPAIRIAQALHWLHDMAVSPAIPSAWPAILGQFDVSGLAIGSMPILSFTADLTRCL